MRQLTPDSFKELIDGASIRPRVKREVRFTTSAANMDDEAWEQTELLAISDRAGNKGVLLLSGTADATYAFAYELSRGITSTTGRAQAIICDFCRTWQTGSRSGSVTLSKPERGAGSVSFLCCADLECSRHVRTLTDASHTSRAQLREDMDTDQRIARLKRRIEEVVEIVTR